MINKTRGDILANYTIVTDTTSDLPNEYLLEHNIGVLSMSFAINGKEYKGNVDFDIKDFYSQMRNGAMPTTAQVNPKEAKNKMESYLKEGLDVLYIAFTSGMSGSFNSGRLAAMELKEEYPNNKVVVVDSLCASLGEGLLVHKAVMLKEAGKSLDEVVKWIEENKLNICHYVTVDDLFHLHRGGRVSKTAAIVGSMINLKPIIHVTNEGKLVPIGKVRGRKQSLNALVKHMKNLVGSYEKENDVIFISHGDAKEDAEYVAKKIKEEFNIDSYLINYIGPTVGAHSGPGTIALFFMGEKR